jgi:parvulin-like peptidyl-prolyl isomerase
MIGNPLSIHSATDGQAIVYGLFVRSKTVKAKFYTLAGAILLAFGLLGLTPATASAQDSELVVIDQVVAQVNNDVITLSMVRREIKDAIQAFVQQGMTEQKATEEVMRRQPEIIASLVNEQLLVQKGKELGLAEEVEAEVNKEMLRVAKQQGIDSIEILDAELVKAGLNPTQIRQTLRTQFMKQAVLSREVDAKIYYGVPAADVKKYYDANRDKFRKPESVTISEIFLSFAGKNEADVKARAQTLLTQLKGGADFGTVAAANSERQAKGELVAKQSRGKVGTFQTPDLLPEIAASIKNVPVGGVSELVRTDDGYQIFRVDERTAAGDTMAFSENTENQVREAITVERRDKEREAYMKNLRRDAYIQLNKDYQATVGPLLSVSAPSATSSITAPATPKNSTNSKPSNGKKQ